MDTKDESYDGENKKFFTFNKKIVIPRDEDGKPYLERRIIISIRGLFSIMYHKVLLSDDVCPHDHPWGFVTFILKGGYYEWTPSNQKERSKVRTARMGVDDTIEFCRWHGVGSVMYRPAKWRHRLELKQSYVDDLTKTENPIPAHTLVFSGRVVRDWGFFTKKGWIFWEKYNKKRDC